MVLASALSTSSTVRRGVVFVLTRPEADTVNESEEAAILSGRSAMTSTSSSPKQ